MLCRAVLSVFLVLSLVLTGDMAGGQTPPKAGARCATSGESQVYKGKRFECLKIGRKLRWSKGVKIQSSPIQANNPTPSPTLSPTPSTSKSVDTNLKYPVTEQARYLQEKINQLLVNMPRQASIANITPIVEPVVANSIFTKDTIAGIPWGMRLLTLLDIVPKPPQDVVIMLNPIWAKSYIDESGGCYDGFCQVIGPNADPVNYTRGVTFVDYDFWARNLKFNPLASNYSSEFEEFMFKANIVHEMAHWGQREVIRRNNSGSRIYVHPAWLREGSADLIKLMFWKEYTGRTYLEVREQFLSKYPSDCVGIDFAELGIPGHTGPEQNGCEYINGLLMVEYLIWKAQDFFAWTKVYDGPDGGGLDKGLLVYGIKLNEFEQEVDQYVFREGCLRLPTCPNSIPKSVRYPDPSWFINQDANKPAGPILISASVKADTFELNFRQDMGRDLKVTTEYGEDLDFLPNGTISVKRKSEFITRIYAFTEDRTSKMRSKNTVVEIDFKNGTWRLIS